MDLRPGTLRCWGSLWRARSAAQHSSLILIQECHQGLAGINRLYILFLHPQCSGDDVVCCSCMCNSCLWYFHLLAPLRLRHPLWSSYHQSCSLWDTGLRAKPAWCYCKHESPVTSGPEMNIRGSDSELTVCLWSALIIVLWFYIITRLKPTQRTKSHNFHQSILYLRKFFVCFIWIKSRIKVKKHWRTKQTYECKNQRESLIFNSNVWHFSVTLTMARLVGPDMKVMILLLNMGYNR